MQAFKAFSVILDVVQLSLSCYFILGLIFSLMLHFTLFLYFKTNYFMIIFYMSCWCTSCNTVVQFMNTFICKQFGLQREAFGKKIAFVYIFCVQ